MASSLKSSSINVTSRYPPTASKSEKFNQEPELPYFLSDKEFPIDQMQLNHKIQNNENIRYNYERHHMLNNQVQQQQQINSSNKYSRSQFQLPQTQNKNDQPEKVQECSNYSSKNGFQEQVKSPAPKADAQISIAPTSTKILSAISPIQVQIPHAEQYHYYHQPPSESFPFSLRDVVNEQNPPRKQFDYKEYFVFKNISNANQVPSSQLKNANCNENIQTEKSPSSMPDLKLLSRPKRKVVLVDKSQQTDFTSKRDQATSDSYERLQYPSYQPQQTPYTQIQFPPPRQSSDHLYPKNIKASSAQNIDFNTLMVERRTNDACFVYPNVPLITYQNKTNLEKHAVAKKDQVPPNIIPSTRSTILCSKCGIEVLASDENVSCGIEKWHRYCFACSVCRIMLSTDNAALCNKQLLCKNCLEKRRFFSEMSK